LHIENASNWTVININGKNGICNLSQKNLSASEVGVPNNRGVSVFAKKDIKSCLNLGWNNITLRLRNRNYNGHIHPGMFMKIDYQLNDSILQASANFSKRYYFDNVTSINGSDSQSGAWAILPFFIPEDSSNVKVAIHIEGRNIRDSSSGTFTAWDGNSKNEKEYDYIIFVNGNTPFGSNSSPASNPIYNYNSSQLSSKIITGTNVVSVYFNCYSDYDWGGTNRPAIYSDPINYPSNSSYVEVNYTLNQQIPYGSIKITRSREFGGSSSNPKSANFSFPSQAIRMGDVFTNIAENISDMVNVYADIYNPPQYNIFSSPSTRAVPTSVFIPRNRLSLSPSANNYMKIQDTNPDNLVLPNSTLEYSFYIPSFVGYGSVFATQSEAEQDALNRLNQTIGSFISSGDLIPDSSGMTDVPSLWGPAIIEVRVWR
jgi:hypothetical protein